MRRRQFLAGFATVGAGCAAPSETPATTTTSRSPTTDPLPGEGEGAWAQYARNANHTAYTPSVSVSNPTAEWRVHTDGPFTAPAVVGETVFVAGGVVPTESESDSPVGAVFALDRATGRERWQTVLPPVPASGGFAACPPIVYRGSVYVGDAGEHGFYALDARTGEVRWSLDPGASVNIAPVASDGVVCFTTRGELVAVDESGRERWRWSRSGYTLMATPAVSDGTVYFGLSSPESGESGGFYALDLETGEERWSVSEGEAYGMPVADDGTVFAADERGIRAFDAENGTVRWARPVDYIGEGASLAADDERIYFTTWQEGLVAVRRSDGSPLWQYQPEHTPHGPATVLKDAVVVATDTSGSGDRVTAYAVDKQTGQQGWSRTVDGTSPYPAAAFDGTVYLPTYMPDQRGTLVALRG